MSRGRGNIGTFTEAAILKLPGTKELIRDAQSGFIDNVATYFRRREGGRTVDDTKALLLDCIIDAPLIFAKKTALIEEVGKDFSFRDFFRAENKNRPTDMLLMYAKNPVPDTAKAGAMLAAAYVKSRIIEDETFVPRFTIPAPKGLKAAAKAMEAAAMRDSIIAIQNALVELVNEKGPDMPFSTAPGALYMLSQMVEPSASQLWTKKIIGFDEAPGERAIRAETILIPRYEPSL